MYARVNSWVESSDGAPGYGKPLRKLDFELRDLTSDWCDSRKDVARPEAQSELVRVVKNDDVVDGQVHC
jgi:hypothetical protein